MPRLLSEMSRQPVSTFLIFLIFTLLFIGVLVSLLLRAFLPWSYVLFSFLACISLTVMIFFEKKSPLVYVFLVISAILFRNLINIVTNFTMIPLYDSYANYAAMNIFMENGRAFIIEPYAGFLGVAIRDASCYPLPLIFVSVLSSVTGISLLQTTLITPTIYSLLMLSFIVLLIKNIVAEFDLKEKVLVLSLLIFTVSPDAIYNGLTFYIRFHAYVFFYMALYLLFGNTFTLNKKRDMKKAMLLMLSYVAMVLSHSLTPFIFALFLLGIHISISFGNKLFGRFVGSSPVRSHSFSLISFTFVSFFAWQLFYTFHVMRTIRQFMDFFLTTFLGTLRTGVQEGLGRTYFVHESLRPEPAIFTLYLRDIAIYIPAIVGFMIFALWFFRKKLNHRSQFLFYSVFSLAMIFVILNVVNFGPLVMKEREALPFIIFFAALFYTRISSSKVILLKLLSVLMIILIVFTAFLSPWSHTHFPLYIYDSSIRFEDVGVHNTLYVNLEPFVNDYTTKDRLFLSDDPQLLYAIMQPKDYTLIRSLDEYLEDPTIIRVFGKPNNYYIVELVHLNPHAHYLLDSEKLEEFKFKLSIQYNIILDAQHYRIYSKE